MSNASPQAAVLTKASGQVYAERQGTRISLAEGDAILSTDTVITDSAGVADVRFLDGSTASLSPGTSLEVRDFAFGEGQEPSFILNLAQGTMRSVSGEVVKQNPDAFKIVTPQATVGIRGTELFTAVQPDGQEVHAVLHIGKDHIVVITGNDGQSVVMDQALQAVNVQGGLTGMQKQTFSLSEMQQVIKTIAPSQVQKPLQPQGPQGERGAPEGAPDGAQPAEATADTAAPAPASSPSGVVVITYEAEAQATAANAESASNVNTLIRVVENLQNALADAGFSVQVTATDTASDSLGTSSSVLGDALLDGGTFVEASTPPPVADTGPVGPVDPVGPQPQVYIINDDYSGNWQADYGADVDPSRAQHITISGALSTKIDVNKPIITGGNATSDTVSVGSLAPGGQVRGDGSLEVRAGESVTTGADTITVGSMVSNATDTAAIAGDSMSFTADTGATITFGNDTITVTSMGTNSRVYGDTSRSIAGGTAHVVLGNDTITVGSMTDGAQIFGDLPGGGYLGKHTYEGGHDTISVGSMSSGSLVSAGLGNDTVNVTTLTGGTVDGGAGNDTITVGTMSGGTVVAGDGMDTLTITGWSNGTVDMRATGRTLDTADPTKVSFSGGQLQAIFSDGTVLRLSGDALGTGDASTVMNNLIANGFVQV